MDFDISVTIRRPPAVVYAMLADVQDYATGPGSPVPEMEKIPPGPTEVGTRWREVVRLAPGVTMTVWTTATLVAPPNRLHLLFHGPWMSGLIAYSFDAHDGACVLRLQETLTPHGPLRLVAGPMSRMLGARLVWRLEAIRARLEREGEGGPSPSAAVPPRPGRATASARRLRWSLAITAVVVELGLFVAWRLRFRRGPRRPATAKPHPKRPISANIPA